VSTKGVISKAVVNMRKEPDATSSVSVGRFSLTKDQAISVVIDTKGASGIVHADAIQIVRVAE